ncbi:MAG TPA: DNA methyltransferase [Gemmatimonadaceae bacterium]
MRVLTMRAAAALLADGSRDGIAALAGALGFDAPPLPLDAAARAALGLDGDAADARVVRGPGALRALLVEAESGRPLRDRVRRIAVRLSSRAPHHLWLLLARERDGGGVAIAAWGAERTPPRVASLVVQAAHVVASDAETLCALAAAREWYDEDGVLAHARWMEVLGRDALTRRFYRTLERLVGALADAAAGRATGEERRELALLATSRLLFLSFLQAKGWLDGRRDFLAHVVTRRLERGGGIHRGCLRPLFFGTLNTPPRRRAALARDFGRVPFLNGGLFTPTPLERRRCDVVFPDEALGALFDELLHRYRFTVREADGSWAESAVDPAMLGRAFESLMGAGERRGSGAYYTPHALVERVAGEALRESLAPADPVASALLDGEMLAETDGARVLARLGALRVLDPACGSGAFLVHLLERLADLRARAGDARPLAERRRGVLARSIFGVDVNPAAVWLCELRLWLSVSVEDEESDPMRVRPLPNLDRNVRVGDALAGEVLPGAAGGSRALVRLRERYARAAGPSKHGLARALDRAERRRALDAVARDLAAVAAARREMAIVRRGRDLFGERHRAAALDDEAAALRERARALRRRERALRDSSALPFSWHTHFADVVDDGGFDAVVGNPPWVRLHRIPPAARAALRRAFTVFRGAAWREGSDDARGGAAFGAQADLAAMFVERALALSRPGAVVAYLLPMKLWRSLAGGGVRALLLRDAELLRLEDWSRAESAFDAAVYPSVLVARRHSVLAAQDADAPPRCAVVVRGRVGASEWRVAPRRLALDDSPGSPWLLLPPAARAAFDRIIAAGTPLSRSPLGTPILGVKSGCNAAFAVRVLAVERGVARVRSGEREGDVEAALLRPLLRGETVAAWRAEPDGERLLWTHGADRRPLERLPPLAARWLAPWRSRLAARADGRGRERWWSLFRPEAADASRPRVVWADIGRVPRAAVVPAGDPCVALNSCYVLPCPALDDALAIAALLNGPLAAAWLRALAEPARGGYVRFLAWTVGRLPLPRDWPRARALLAPLGARATSGDVPSPAELLDGALEAYGLDGAAIAPLLCWSEE